MVNFTILQVVLLTLLAFIKQLDRMDDAEKAKAQS